MKDEEEESKRGMKKKERAMMFLQGKMQKEVIIKAKIWI